MDGAGCYGALLKRRVSIKNPDLPSRLGFAVKNALSSGSLRSAMTTCRQSTTTTTTTGNPNGDSVLGGGLQREILGFYHKLYYANNTAAKNVALSISAYFPYLLQQEAAAKLCVMTQLGFVQDSLFSLPNILSFYTTSTIFTTAVTSCVTNANAVTGDISAKARDSTYLRMQIMHSHFDCMKLQ
ncbi:unnamed protein product [Darwinula stevensoni]|uniref:Uncharacterized protein n=1 Tax=Darwinula stevensoni TaxID=69355 RepID=A0A7R9ABL0_9CRUS|nr:unnamed protein product [Darwinula stevensoni]CAG0899159.1 unnamed protein product [Darwinula stevensoni]